MTRAVVALAAAVMLAGAPPKTDAAGQQQATPPVAAQSDSALDAATRALAADLRCPVCQGLSIGDSPSELALEMRSVIKDQLRAGRTPDEVRQYFVDKYGEWILLAPEPRGFNLLVYLLPAGALLAGLALVWRVVRRWTAAGAEATRESGAGIQP